ncbi:MAG: hypothetical protein NW207_02345 [Cytophagales bacterium]|nr:hypothetical protein [Cytophagales bacterium]
MPYILYSQAKQDKYQDTFDGGPMTTKAPLVPDNYAPQSRPLILLKYDNRDLLQGNACVREETLKMGFEYLVLCERQVRFSNRVYVYFYNFGTNFELTFRNGFGWKKRLKQKIVQCRRNSGDFVW